MRTQRRRRGFVAAIAVAFLAGATTALVWNYTTTATLNARLSDDCGDPSDAARSTGTPEPEPRPEPVTRTARIPDLPPRIETNPLADLRERRLTLPVKGIGADDLTRSFDDERSGGRKHEAMDILAPRNTPVLAVEDGVIARLFESKAGGLTVYQFDPSYSYAYYYAHLEKYADGLSGGDRVRRGQVLGYVGTSGNAPPNTPHLHFAIFKLTDKKQWWKGNAIDPFLILR